MSELMDVWHHPIHSNLDYQPCMEVTTELEYSSNFQFSYPNRGIHTNMESTASFDRIIRDYHRIGQIMNRFPEFSNGVVTITYHDKTYNMRCDDDATELRRAAIHYIGLPDL